MIAGTVSDEDEPLVSLRVRGAAGTEVVVLALVDTGFTGWLTLPPAVIAHLGLSWRRDDAVFLADGREARTQMYDGVVVWDGRARRILVDSADVAPIIGTRLLAGHRLTVQFRSGGPVLIEPLG